MDSEVYCSEHKEQVEHFKNKMPNLLWKEYLGFNGKITFCALCLPIVSNQTQTLLQKASIIWKSSTAWLDFTIPGQSEGKLLEHGGL